VILKDLLDFSRRASTIPSRNALNFVFEFGGQTDKKTNAIFCGHLKTSL
jgi:hypothetical protein